MTDLFDYGASPRLMRDVARSAYKARESNAVLDIPSYSRTD